MLRNFIRQWLTDTLTDSIDEIFVSYRLRVNKRMNEFEDQLNILSTEQGLSQDPTKDDEVLKLQKEKDELMEVNKELTRQIKLLGQMVSSEIDTVKERVIRMVLERD